MGFWNALDHPTARKVANASGIAGAITAVGGTLKWAYDQYQVVGAGLTLLWIIALALIAIAIGYYVVEFVRVRGWLAPRWPIPRWAMVPPPPPDVPEKDYTADALKTLLERRRSESRSGPDWSPYDFYRDQIREVVALYSRPTTDFGQELAVAVDHGVLLGKIIGTLEAKGYAQDSDTLYPYGQPRFVDHYVTDEQINEGDFIYPHRKMLMELEGRLRELQKNYRTTRGAQ